MPARRAELELESRSAEPRPKREPASGSTKHRRASRRSPAPNVRTPSPRARALLQPLELRRVAVEDGDAARNEAGKNLRLGVGDGLDRAEIFDMHRRDRGDQRDMGPHEADQRRDLARMVHADLEHARKRRRRGSRESVSGTPQWLL